MSFDYCKTADHLSYNHNMSSNTTTTSNSSDDETMNSSMDGLRRGPWMVEEDIALVNYIAVHGEGRWNSLARCAGLKRTGKSCRLRWLNYLRPDVRRGNITPQEQLLILELHSRWGNRWSKIAQYLPGRTDNEIKNYWRTRVQKHAKQLKCDVNSQQFKDTMRYLWMPRLIERIQAASSSSSPIHTATAATLSTTISNTCNHDLSREDYSPLPLPLPLPLPQYGVNPPQAPAPATAPIGMTPPPSYNNYSNISSSDNSSTSDSIIDNQVVLSSPASTGIDPYAACSTTGYHNNMDHQVGGDYLMISPSSNYFNHGDQTMTTTDMDYYQWSNGDYYHTPNHDIDVSFWNY